MQKQPEFLYEYPYQGERCQGTLRAEDLDDARRKLVASALNGRIVGEVEPIERASAASSWLTGIVMGLIAGVIITAAVLA